MLSGHKGLVNRICWHPTDPHLLVSASQDTQVKLWDIRVKNGEAIGDERKAYAPGAFATGDKVRQAGALDYSMPATVFAPDRAQSALGHPSIFISLWCGAPWHCN